MNSKILIVIPTYNEEKRIETILSKYHNHFKDQEIIIVCDGTDTSKNIVEKLSENYPNIKLLSFEKRLGKGQVSILTLILEGV